MKILFIENRYKTFLYKEIANHLLKNGHKVHWLIQNHEFTVNNGFNHIIPYPKTKEHINSIIDLSEIIKSDRQINFFKKKDTAHFNYYYTEIKRIIQEIKPNFIFGEATAFHELLTIKISKEEKIVYLNPCTNRYPISRFSFYLYDTLEPYSGSNETFSNKEANGVISSIINREVKPDYMNIKAKKNSIKINDKIKLLKAYYKGERYNTPSPIIKYNLDKTVQKLILKWNAIAVKSVNKEHFAILYPMQMQPEANIDVWGRKHRNQLKTIKKIHKQLGDNEVLYIKLNPKCKYELSKDLISFIKDKKNIVAIDLSVGMDTIFIDSDLIITVTGTVAMESIWSNKPVITLVKTLNNTNKNCIYLEDLCELKKWISQVKLKIFPVIKEEEKLNFVHLLTETSFKGVISDPFTNERCIDKANIDNLCFAFNKVINE